MTCHRTRASVKEVCRLFYNEFSGFRIRAGKRRGESGNGQLSSFPDMTEEVSGHPYSHGKRTEEDCFCKNKEMWKGVGKVKEKREKGPGQSGGWQGGTLFFSERKGAVWQAPRGGRERRPGYGIHTRAFGLCARGRAGRRRGRGCLNNVGLRAREGQAAFSMREAVFWPYAPVRGRPPGPSGGRPCLHTSSRGRGKGPYLSS